MQCQVGQHPTLASDTMHYLTVITDERDYFCFCSVSRLASAVPFVAGMVAAPSLELLPCAALVALFMLLSTSRPFTTFRMRCPTSPEPSSFDMRDSNRVASTSSLAIVSKVFDLVNASYQLPFLDTLSSYPDLIERPLPLAPILCKDWPHDAHHRSLR